MNFGKKSIITFFVTFSQKPYFGKFTCSASRNLWQWIFVFVPLFSLATRDGCWNQSLPPNDALIQCGRTSIDKRIIFLNKRVYNFVYLLIFLNLLLLILFSTPFFTRDHMLKLRRDLLACILACNLTCMYNGREFSQKINSW